MSYINKIFKRYFVEIFSFILIFGISLYLLHKNPIVFDLTEGKKYSLDKKIIDLFRNLDDKVYVKVFYSDSNERNNIEKILSNISRYTNKVKYDFLDPRRDIQAQEIYGFTSSNQILIMYKGRKKIENTIDNEKFANIVYSLMKQKEGKVLFSVGHKEPSIDDQNQNGLSTFVSSLKDQGFDVGNVNLATDQIYNPVALFIISPEIDLSANEVKKIKEYLYNGGKVVIALKNYQKDKFKNLDVLIESYGIKVSNNHLIDPRNNPASIVIANVVNLPYLSNLNNVNFYFMFPNIIESVSEKDDVSLSEVVTSNGVLIDPNLLKKGKVSTINVRDIKNYTVGMISEKVEGSNKSYLLVFGDYAFLSNAFVNSTENINLILAFVDYFSGSENFIVKPKEVPSLPVIIPSGQLLFLTLLYLALPFLFLGFSMFFVLKRRGAHSNEGK